MNTIVIVLIIIILGLIATSIFLFMKQNLLKQELQETLDDFKTLIDDTERLEQEFKAEFKKQLDAQETYEQTIKDLRQNSKQQLIVIQDLNDEIKKVTEQNEHLKKELNSDSFDGLFPICSHCKDIRDDTGAWHSIEEYLANLSKSEFSHSLCPKCARELYPDMFEDGNKMKTLTWR